MTTPTILMDKTHNNCVLRLFLNRPEVHNAFDDTLIQELTHQFEKAGQNPSIRAIILMAEGKSFCAGADLNWMKQFSKYSLEENIADGERLSKLMQTIDTCPKPVIALVQGAAYGGGVGLVAACDIAIAVEEVVFSLSEVRLGLVAAVISPYVINAIGQRQARRYALTAEKMSAQDALRMGLVHQVVSADKLQKAGDDIVSHLLKGSPMALTATKKMIQFVESRPIDDVVIYQTARQIAEARLSEEGQEGMQAFLNKRSPVWVK